MLKMGKKLLSIIIPCYNEEKTVETIYVAITDTMDMLPQYDYEILFVNDGSKDNTLNKLTGLSEMDVHVKYYSFSRNFGKEAAIYAGLNNARGDYVVIMDADMQDPPALLPEMISTLESGEYDSVATRRVSRKGEPMVRSFCARCFYKLICRISDADIVDGARDFRMMTRDMVNSVLALSEYNRFSKGIFGWVGYRTKWLEYENIERAAGETKWNVKKLFIYSLEGITGFSVVPLSIAAYMGVLFCGLSFLMIVAIVVRTLIWGDPVAGWPSMVCILFGVGGVQLLCTGILGQYLAKTYLEVKNRPVYLLKDSSKEEQRIMMMPLSQNLRRKSYGQG